MTDRVNLRFTWFVESIGFIGLTQQTQETQETEQTLAFALPFAVEERSHSC
jgi:hypothetical protein